MKAASHESSVSIWYASAPLTAVQRNVGRREPRDQTLPVCSPENGRSCAGPAVVAARGSGRSPEQAATNTDAAHRPAVASPNDIRGTNGIILSRFLPLRARVRSRVRDHKAVRACNAHASSDFPACRNRPGSPDSPSVWIRMSTSSASRLRSRHLRRRIPNPSCGAGRLAIFSRRSP